MTAFAFCDTEKQVKKKSIKKKSKKPVKMTVKKSDNKPKNDNIQVKSKSKKKFVPKFNVNILEKKYVMPEEKRIIPKEWELPPDRKTFQNWIFDTYKDYVSKKGCHKIRKRCQIFIF